MAAWKVIAKYLDGQRVVCASLGLLLVLIPAGGFLADGATRQTDKRMRCC